MPVNISATGVGETSGEISVCPSLANSITLLYEKVTRIEIMVQVCIECI